MDSTSMLHSIGRKTTDILVMRYIAPLFPRKPRHSALYSHPRVPVSNYKLTPKVSHLVPGRKQEEKRGHEHCFVIQHGRIPDSRIDHRKGE